MSSKGYSTGAHVVYKLSVLAQHLKGLSSRRVRKRRFPEVTSTLWGRAFWSPSYCAVSCGGAPLATVKAYVEAQRGLPSPAVGALENWRPKPMNLHAPILNTHGLVDRLVKALVLQPRAAVAQAPAELAGARGGVDDRHGRNPGHAITTP